MSDTRSYETGAARWLVVAGAFLGMICFSASRHMYPYVLPEMGKGLDLPNERMGNISSAYFVAYMLCSLMWGVLADRLGPRRVMLIGIALICSGLLAMGSTTSFVMAFGCNMLCGAGASALSVPQVPLLSRWFPVKGRGLAIGSAMMGNGLATFTFGLWIPLVILAGGWRWAWWASAILVAVMWTFCFILLREAPARSALPRLDRAPDTSRPAHPGHPPTIKDVLRQRTAWNLIAIYAIWGTGYTVFMTFAVAYLREQGWDPSSASRAFALWGIFTLFGSVAWGSLSDRYLKKWVLAVALVLQGVGYVAFLAVSASQAIAAGIGAGPGGAAIIGTVGAFAGAAAVGFGQIGIPAVLSAATGDYFSPRIAGRAFGLLTLCFAGGCIIGPSLGGFVSDATGTLRTGLLFGFVALCISLLATLVLERPKPNVE